MYIGLLYVDTRRIKNLHSILAIWYSMLFISVPWPKQIKETLNTSTDVFNMFFENRALAQRGLDFSSLGGRSWEQNSTKNLSKHGIQDGMHLGSDFSLMLMNLGGQVGFKNPPKIGLAGLAWRGEASWRGVMAWRGEARKARKA